MVKTLAEITFYGTGSPNGAFQAAQGNVFIRTDTPQVWVNTSNGGFGTTWELIGPPDF